MFLEVPTTGRAVAKKQKRENLFLFHLICS